MKSSREAAGELRAPRRRRRRDERRHRPQPRADAAQLADRAGRRRARAPDLRRARPRRRPDAGHRRGRRRDDGQQGPDVGLRRGHPQLGPGLARPRDPHPARPVVDVVRRHRQAARGHVGRPGRGLDRRDEADPGHRPRLLVVRAHAVDHREGVRPLRLRAEPRHHRQGPEVPRPEPAREGRPRPGRGVQGARRRLRRGRHPRRAGDRDERARPRAAARRSTTSSGRSSRATARSTTPSPRTSR